MQEFSIALFAGLVGGLLSYLLQNFASLRSEDVASINDHISEIREIEKFAIGYWLNVASVNPEEELRFSTCLSGAMSASTCFNEVARKVMGRLYAEYVVLDQQLYEAATGGDFQSVVKEPDPNRVIEIMTTCNEMRSLLRKARRSLFWAH